METLKNTYYAFRHGQSQANVDGIIISDPDVGTKEYGMTEEGIRQVYTSIALLDVANSEALIKKLMRSVDLIN